MLARVRWTNLAAALTVAGILVLIVGWPLLAPAPPKLPPDPPPLAAATPTPRPTATFERRAPKVRAPVRRRAREGARRRPAAGPARRLARAKRRKERTRPTAAVREAGARAVVPVPAVVAPPAAPAPRREFSGFEQ